MNSKRTSIFNLIEIFRRPKKPVLNMINAKTHCEQKQHHDFYCDAEKPHIKFNN